MTGKHGKSSTCNAGCRCEPCRAERMRYEKRRRIALARAGAPTSQRGRWLVGRVYTRDLVGVTRRLRALARMGYRATDVAAATGLHPVQVQRYMAGNETAVLKTSYDKIAAAYNQLSMTPGPSTLARNRAEAKHWPPPLAWDDDTIDNPNAQPNLGHYQPGHGTRKLPDLEILVAAVNDSGVRNVAQRYRVDRTTVQKALNRGGYYAVTDGQSTTTNHPTYMRKEPAA